MKKIAIRLVGFIPAAALQILWFVVLFHWLSPYTTAINIGMTFLALVFVVYLFSSRQENTYKTVWLILIVTVPVFGASLYLFFGNRSTSKRLNQKIVQAEKGIPLESACIDPANAVPGKRLGQTFSHITSLSGYSLHGYQDAAYYSLGEYAWEDMKSAMEKAEKYIYVEYFIVEPGLMWDSMVEIMVRKAEEGLDVRVMFDDMGSISTMTAFNAADLRKKGIKCAVFNPIIFLRGAANNRDHRKMLIIDGHTAFSGGINLADEYINKKVKYGHWKDIAFKITGSAVQTYLRMYVTFWNAFERDKISEKVFESESLETGGKGIALSYYDNPYHTEHISNSLFTDLLNQATDRAWFYTPYLMLGDELLNAFRLAANRGVDVRIIFPGVPDKKLAYRISRSYYIQLLDAGVKIYEYTPGFVHAKASIIDDKICTIGTVNLDYRSLFLHFENNTLFYDAPILKDLEKDFLATQESCLLRTPENWSKKPLRGIVDGVLRLIAPLF